MGDLTSGLCEPARTVRFGAYEVDLRSRELRKRGLRLHLQEKPFQILELLLERAGEVITRSELRVKLWPGIVAGFDRRLNTSINMLRQILGDSAGSPRFIETRSRWGYRFIASVEILPAANGPAALEVSDALDSIAVLPFENLGGDPEADYLSDGITESLLQGISELPGIRVMARSSVFRYKGKKVDPCEVGRELKVRSVLSGIVDRKPARGGKLVVAAELVEVPHGWRLWGKRFERSLSDVAFVEEEILQEISRSLRPRLAEETLMRRGRHPAPNADAHLDYLWGRYHWNKLTEEGLRKSIAFFESATRKDPQYALAYSGLADAYGLCGFFGAVAPLQIIAPARRAALRSIEADPNLGEAHASLASILKVFEWDWAGAEREYRLAISLNPNYANARRWYAGFLSAHGRVQEGLREIRIACELDPLSLVTGVELPRHYFMARQFDRARKESLKILNREAEFPAANHNLGLACEQLGYFDEALAAFEQARTASQAHASTLAALGYAYGRRGMCESAVCVLDDLQQRKARGYVPSYLIALVYAGLGRADDAFACLETAFTERDVWLVWLKVEPRFDSLRSDPRFRDLLARLNFSS